MICTNERRVRKHCCELLEDRIALSVTGITDYEQLLIELVNRARANPSAEASLHGTTLNDKLPANTITNSPKPPLAPEQILSNTAGAYSDRMLRDDFFSHTDPDGDLPWDRTEDNGYPVWAGVGENIAWGTFFGDREATIHARHRSLFRSAGHRENMMDPDWNELGVGIKFGTTPYQSVTATDFDLAIVTEVFGGRSNLKYLTGVAFNDADANDFYSVGEGVSNVTVTATNSSGTFTTDTASSGGYVLRLAPGTYSVTASGNGIDAPATTITIGSDNVKLDFEPGSTDPDPDPDPVDVEGAIGEVGRLTVPASTASKPWRTVSLDRTYSNPVVVVSPISSNDSDPAVVRVRNITANSFQYRIDEWAYQDGAHDSEQIGFMVVEAGSHELPGGERLVAGSVQANHDLATVSLSGFSTMPNIIATVGSFAGGAPVTPRIHNVSMTQFQIQVQEEEGSDGLHATETIGYIAFESGSGQAGNLDYVGGNTGRTVTQNASSISLGARFSESPVFLATVSSRYGADPVGLRSDGITATRANVYLQEEQSKDAEVGHTTENVSFLAIEPGIVVAGQNDSGTNRPPTILDQSFHVDENAASSTLVGTVQANDPDADAMTYSIIGGNPANAFSIDAAGRIRVSNPAEIGAHSQFVLTVQVADVATNTAAAEVTIDVNPVVVSTLEIGEIGTVTRAQASRNTWHTVNFSRAYSNPVVVMGPLSSRVNVPALVRVRNVTASSFQWQIDEWDYLDGIHGTETASYMVVEAGTHTLSNGTRLVAGKANVNHQAVNVDLPGLNGKPVVLATVASVKGSSAVTTRVNNVTGDGFRVRLQEEEGNDGRHARETVTYVAIEQGSGTSNGRPFVARTGNASNSKSIVSFGATFGAAPALFANMQSLNGGDVASLRFSSLTTTKFDVTVREEQSKDKELNHATEVIGFFAMPTGTISVANSASAGIRNTNNGRAQAIGRFENIQDRSAVEAYRQSQGDRPLRTSDRPSPLNALYVESAFQHVELTETLDSLF